MDGRPKRRNKAAFSNLSSVVWTGIMKLCASRLLYLSFFLADPDFAEAIGILGVGVGVGRFVFCSSSCIRSLKDWTGTGSLFTPPLKPNKQRTKN